MNLSTSLSFFAVLRFVLCGLIVPSLSHAMLYQPSPIVQKVIKKDIVSSGERFISTMPSLSVTEIDKKFAAHSSLQKTAIRSLLAEKDHKNNNKMFSAVFYMATKLPQEIQRKILPFGHDEEAMNQFLTMPVGKALEWWAFVQRAARGRIAYLPICKPLFEQEGCLFKCSDRISCDHEGTITFYNYTESSHSYSSTWVLMATVDKEKCLYSIRRKRDDVTGFRGADVEVFLDQIASQLFRLSMKELCALIYVQKKTGPIALGDKELEQLVDIDKRMPFLAMNETGITYYKDNSIIDVLKNGAQFGMRSILPKLVFPIISVGISNISKAQWAHGPCDSWGVTKILVPSMPSLVWYSAFFIWVFRKIIHPYPECHELSMIETAVGLSCSGYMHCYLFFELGTNLTNYAYYLGGAGALSNALGMLKNIVHVYIDGDYETIQCKDIAGIVEKKDKYGK